MGILFEERASDSPYVESVTHGHMLGPDSSRRPAECHWHMVFVKHSGGPQLIVTGPLTSAGDITWDGSAEVVWIKFRLGTFMPHLPIKTLLDLETPLPGAATHSFWLKGSAWQFPTYDNVDTFVDRLMRQDVLVRDPLVDAALQAPLLDISPRTLRHRFIRATGLTQGQIQQMLRAQRAAELLRRGVPILDTVDEAGYFDQPHLTRSLKLWIGHTPAQLLKQSG